MLYLKILTLCVNCEYTYAKTRVAPTVENTKLDGEAFLSLSFSASSTAVIPLMSLSCFMGCMMLI